MAKQIFQRRVIHLILKDYMTDLDLSKEKINRLLNFNFETYRKQSSSEYIKISEDFLLELYSRDQIETGQPDEIIEEDSNENSNAEQTISDDHHGANEYKIRKVEIIKVNLF